MSKNLYIKTKIQPEFILFEDLKFNKKYIHELSQIIENKKETKIKFLEILIKLKLQMINS